MALRLLKGTRGVSSGKIVSIMNRMARLVICCLLAAMVCSSKVLAAGPVLDYPILFVTQVPNPGDFTIAGTSNSRSICACPAARRPLAPPGRFTTSRISRFTRPIRFAVSGFPATALAPDPSGPPASVAIATDGSVAAFVPARRALSWQMTDPAGGPVVRERYWVTFQSGEIRTCANCHGINRRQQREQRTRTG